MPRRRDKQLNWGAERRNAFIEFRVFWHGRINRADLIDTFGISLQQASLDLAGYAEQCKRHSELSPLSQTRSVTEGR